METLFPPAVRLFHPSLIPDMPLGIWTLYFEILSKIVAYFEKGCIFAVVNQSTFTSIKNT